MPLTSDHFQGSPRLQACLVSDRAHVTEGQSGDHVGLIQAALRVLENAVIAPGELASKTYEKSTASAVLAYKTKRTIINRSYQKTPDSIVGKMTIAALDRDMLERQQSSSEGQRCTRLLPPIQARSLVGSIPDTVPLEIAAIWDGYDQKNRRA